MMYIVLMYSYGHIDEFGPYDLEEAKGKYEKYKSQGDQVTLAQVLESTVMREE